MDDSLRILTQRISRLPTIPPVADRIIELVSSKCSVVSNVVDAIEQDPAISAKVISFSNTAFYRTGEPVVNIKDAVMKIGFDNIKSIALGISLLTVFRAVNKSRQHDYALIFRHCLAVGIISKEIVDYLGWHNRDDVFTSGLLHDLGLMVILSFFEDIGDKVSALAGKNKTYVDAETEIYGSTHSDVGAWLADKWHLPEIICEAIHYHHNLGAAGPHAETAAVVQIADGLAVKKGYGPINGAGFEDRIREEAFNALGLTRRQVDVMTAKVDEMIAEMQELSL